MDDNAAYEVVRDPEYYMIVQNTHLTCINGH